MAGCWPFSVQNMMYGLAILAYFQGHRLVVKDLVSCSQLGQQAAKILCIASLNYRPCPRSDGDLKHDGH